eukprot:gene6333-7059_t
MSGGSEKLTASGTNGVRTRKTNVGTLKGERRSFFWAEILTVVKKMKTTIDNFDGSPQEEARIADKKSKHMTMDENNYLCMESDGTVIDITNTGYLVSNMGGSCFRQAFLRKVLEETLAYNRLACVEGMDVPEAMGRGGEFRRHIDKCHLNAKRIVRYERLGMMPCKALHQEKSLKREDRAHYHCPECGERIQQNEKLTASGTNGVRTRKTNVGTLKGERRSFFWAEILTVVKKMKTTIDTSTVHPKKKPYIYELRIAIDITACNPGRNLDFVHLILRDCR